MFPTKKKWNQNLHFKIRKKKNKKKNTKKHYFISKKLKLTFSLQKWCLGSQMWVNQKESLIYYQEMHILLEVLSTVYSLSVGNFRGILFPQRVGLFFWPYLFDFYSKEGWVCLILLWQSIVIIKQRIFRYCEKKFILG